MLIYLIPFSTENKVLRFNENGTFKIAQFTDLHFGEGEDTTWGPWQDKNSLKVMKTILNLEKPDLVVLTGDMLTGNNILNNATDYWKIMVSPMLNLGYPWVVAFGNHDDLASGVDGSRKDLLEFDLQFPLSFSQLGPSNIHGVSNYVLQILSSTSDDVRHLIYILDSNDSDCEGVKGSGCIHKDQIEWYRKQSEEIKKRNGKTIKGISYFHIPLQEYITLWNSEIVYGSMNDSVISCQAVNTGLFDVMRSMGDIYGIFVGHNHGNDYCGVLDNIQLCYGRHTGYGGYGNWKRGSRIVEINENHLDRNHKTWIRFEDGSISDNLNNIHYPNQGPKINKCSN